MSLFLDVYHLQYDLKCLCPWDDRWWFVDALHPNFFVFEQHTEFESEALVLASVNWIARLLAHSLQVANVIKKSGVFLYTFFPRNLSLLHETVCIFQQDVDMAPRLGGSRGSKGKKGWESGTRNCNFSPFHGLQQLHPWKLRFKKAKIIQLWRKVIWTIHLHFWVQNVRAPMDQIWFGGMEGWLHR